jgi:hypothetical protein
MGWENMSDDKKKKYIQNHVEAFWVVTPFNAEVI